jgi:glutathione S-transferase
VRLYDYAASANCYKARLLLALLRREYVRIPVDIFAGDTLTAEYAALNPARETPILQLDDGTLLPQSHAILWFLGEGTAFLPPNLLQRAQVVQWLLFEQEHVMTGIGGARFRILTGRDPDLIPSRLQLATSGLTMLEAQLRAAPFLVGDTCSIADIANFAYTHVAGEAGLELADHPAVGAWLERITELPGFVDDLIPYPDNACLGSSRSIYDPPSALP